MHLEKDPSIFAPSASPSPTLIPPSHLQPHNPKAEKQEEEQPTKSHLYFAYGSNLSHTQMRLRCTTNPSLSARPVAIAVLHGWRWLICRAGYANVVPPVNLHLHSYLHEHEHERENENENENERPCLSRGVEPVPVPVPVPVSDSNGDGNGNGTGTGTEDKDMVYGILYEMDSDDERILDGYEGVDAFSPVNSCDGSGVPASIRPREQGYGHYNKWYVPAQVVRWLDEGYKGRKEFEMGDGDGDGVRVLVYVDELRIQVGLPKDEYVPRMNRAIYEAVELGVPGEWVERVMRPFIPFLN